LGLAYGAVATGLLLLSRQVSGRWGSKETAALSAIRKFGGLAICGREAEPRMLSAAEVTLNSYSANRDTLAHVLSAYLSMVNLKFDYEQTLLDRETALAHLETLTGEAIR